MKFRKSIVIKTLFILVSSQLLFNVSKANSAEKLKLFYSIFSRTVEVDSLKNLLKKVIPQKVKRILKATGSTDKEIRSVLIKILKSQFRLQAN